MIYIVESTNSLCNMHDDSTIRYECTMFQERNPSAAAHVGNVSASRVH